MRRPLHPDVALGVHLDAICSRNMYTSDPGPVVDELLRAARHRPEILAREVRTWAGFWEDDPAIRALTAALLEQIPGAAGWAHVGRERSGARTHGTPGLRDTQTALRSAIADICAASVCTA
jgi:hypothetical protein